MDVPKHELDTLKNHRVVFVIFLFEVLPFTDDAL